LPLHNRPDMAATARPHAPLLDVLTDGRQQLLALAA
jgi:hypothetical protein